MLFACFVIVTFAIALHSTDIFILRNSYINKLLSLSLYLVLPKGYVLARLVNDMLKRQEKKTKKKST